MVDTATDWQPPKDAIPKIVCAACRTSHHMILGPRHFDAVMQKTILRYFSFMDPHKMDQGFIDQWGRFYTRKEAMKAVKASGQPFDLERNGGQDVELFSAGIY